MLRSGGRESRWDAIDRRSTVLSYDDHPAIRGMYQWACIERIEGINYSIHTARQRAELLISSWTSKQVVQVGTRHLRMPRDLLTAAPSKSVALVSSFTSEKGKFKMSTKTNGKLPPGTEPDLSKRSPLLVELETKIVLPPKKRTRKFG